MDASTSNNDDGLHAVGDPVASSPVSSLSPMRFRTPSTPGRLELDPDDSSLAVDGSIPLSHARILPLSIRPRSVDPDRLFSVDEPILDHGGLRPPEPNVSVVAVRQDRCIAC